MTPTPPRPATCYRVRTASPDGAFDGVPYDQFHERCQQLKQELNIPDQAEATTVAARASIDPSSLGPHTRVSGKPVIALTACGLTRPSTLEPW